MEPGVLSPAANGDQLSVLSGESGSEGQLTVIMLVLTNVSSYVEYVLFTFAITVSPHIVRHELINENVVLGPGHPLVTHAV